MSSILVKKLLLLSAFCFLLEAFRMLFTETIIYIFLPWNLILAWIPLVLAGLFNSERSPVKLVLYFMSWLLFFPNAPYIITDLIHLRPRNDFPLWFDSILIYSFAFTGLFIGIVSALIVYGKLRSIVSPVWAKSIIICSMLLSGHGIYIGRYLRWYSWSIVTNPGQILDDTITLVINPLQYPGTYGVTLILGTLLTLVFLVLESFTEAKKQGELI